ncbi:MAG: alpha/beta hydrolase [Simkaniaceae bacterium]|nr:alpha/beta hydrolase [Simkaniaceae bacterium]
MTYPYVLISGLLTTPSIWNLAAPLLPSTPLYYAPLGKNTIQEEALALHRYLLKLGITECHLIGHSMGGTIALEYTLLHKERVKSLSLCSTFSHLLYKERSLARLNLIASLIHIPKLTMIKATLPLLFSPKASPYAKQLYIHMAKEIPSAVFQRQLRACLAFNREKDLPLISVPTKIIFNETDRLLSPMHSQKLCKGIPHAHTTVLSNGGHIPQLESPQHFVKAILD